MIRAVVLDASAFAAELLGWPFFVTSIWRTAEEEKKLGGTGIHPAWRAIDVRTRDRKEADVEMVVAYISGRWIYDPTRPEKPVVYTAEHGTGPHAHFQTHPLTARRGIVRGK